MAVTEVWILIQARPDYPGMGRGGARVGARCCAPPTPGGPQVLIANPDMPNFFFKLDSGNC